MHLCRSSSNVPRLPSFLEMLQNPHVLLTFEKVHNPLRLPRETTSEHQKAVRACGAFNMFASKCASRHNGVHFFDISTSKSAPNPSDFYTFDFEVCFEPQRGALFRHLNLPKWSEHGVFCNFFHIWTSKCASRRNVCFVRFYFEMCFAPQRRATCHPSSDYMALHLPLLRAYFSTLRSHKSLEKHSVSWLSYLIAHLDHLSSETFSFWSSFFFSSLLWLFPSLLFICPYCRKFDF